MEARYLYKIAFTDDPRNLRAEVYVIDSDPARTKHGMPARVEAAGEAVTVRFARFGRVDNLTFDTTAQRLSGHTLFNGQKRNQSLWAQRVG